MNSNDVDLELEAVFRFSPLPMFVLDNEWNVRYWNAAAERKFGWQAADVLGKPLPIVASASELENSESPDATSDDEDLVRVQVFRRDAPLAPAEARISVAPIFDPNGERDGTLGIVTEVTEGSVSDWVLDNSAERYRLLYEFNPYPAWVYDLKSLMFISVNEAAIRHYGYTQAEFLSMSVTDILLPDEIPAFHQSRLNTLTENVGWQKIWKHRRSDGTLIDVETSMKPFVSKGRRVELVLIRDITEQLKIDAEKNFERNLLHTLMENIPDAIYFKDIDSSFIRVNNAHAATLGLKNPDDAVGKSDFDFFTSETSRESYSDEQTLMKTGVPLVDKLERITKANGQIVWVSATKVPMISNGGEISGLAGISRDVTERKQAEERLKLFATRLEQSNRELQDFASVASHDLQEPLRKIQAFSDRLKTKCGNELTAEGLDYLDRMQNSAGRMQTLISDLLTFSRISTRTRALRPVDLNNVVKGVLVDLEYRIEQTSGTVDVGPLGVIDADSPQIRQLIQNLVGNALKFHRPRTPPVVTIRSEFLPISLTGNAGSGVSNEFCRLTFADNGIGFEEKYLDRIFNVFQRLHGRGAYEGTGIGLAICRKIVERHRGQITATSQPDVGSVFIVTLPVRQQGREVEDGEI